MTGVAPDFRTKSGLNGDFRARNAVEVSRQKAKSGKILCLPGADGPAAGAWFYLSFYSLTFPRSRGKQ
ncbi:hypothetical protein ACTMU2_01045 [Cupriavidus basilensis]